MYVQAKVQTLEQRDCVAVQLLLADQAQFRPGHSSQEDVLRNREARNRARFLVDDRDAESQGMVRAVDVDRAAMQVDRAGIRLEGA